MNQRSSAFARALAATALALGAIVLIVAIASSVGGDGSGGGGGRARAGHATHKSKPKGEIPATYTVQNGDTLTSIAHQTGVPVARILSLNPSVDPQILISGEELKLK